MTASRTDDRAPEPAPEPENPHQVPDGRDLGPGGVSALGRAVITMAAVRRGVLVEPDKATDHYGVGPPTDVMAITSLPRDSRRPATGHPGLPPAT